MSEADRKWIMGKIARAIAYGRANQAYALTRAYAHALTH